MRGPFWPSVLVLVTDSPVWARLQLLSLMVRTMRNLSSKSFRLSESRSETERLLESYSDRHRM